MAAQVGDIRRFEQQGRRQLVFDRQIELLGIAWLIVRINADHAAARIVSVRQIERGNRWEAVTDASRDEEVAGRKAVDWPERHVALQA